MTEKILLVEDDPMIGEAVVNALADAGKAADWARSGWEATGFLSETSTMPCCWTWACLARMA